MGVLKFWSLPDKPPANPDCFIVISYGLKNRRIPNRPTRGIIRLAYYWWKRFPKARVIMSTGDNQGLGVANSEVMAEYGRRLGIVAGNLIEESQSMNTYENLLYSKKIVKAGRFKQPTIIALDLHIRRAVLTANRLGWRSFYWLSSFSRGEPSYGCKCLQTSSRFTIFCYEVLATIYSRIVGWI